MKNEVASFNTDTTQGGQFLTFQCAGEQYALSIASIKEIIEYGLVTPVPRMPAFIRGVINLRGSVVPVIDMAARLGFAPTPVRNRTCVVMIELQTEDGPMGMGLMVDGVSEVIDLTPQDMQPSPNFGARIRADFIACMARVKGKFVIVMRIEQVLSVSEMADLARMGCEQRV